MILLDADVLLIELRYMRDVKYLTNQQALQQLKADGIQLGMTSQAMLEVIGNLSYNLSPPRVPQLPAILKIQYSLEIYPNPDLFPDYAGCTVPQLVAEMSKKMSLGDAVQSLQIAAHASFADALLTWNAKHFTGKLCIPVLTPEDWLNQRKSRTP